MRVTKAVRRLAAVCVLVVAGVVLTASPASATSTYWDGNFWVNSADDYFVYEVYSDIFPGFPSNQNASTFVKLKLGPASVVSATDCKVTFWTHLAVDGGTPWDSPHTTRDCEDLITSLRGQWHYYGGVPDPIADRPVWNTVANQNQGRFCVDLYYNGSTHSGWQRCGTGLWTNL